MLAYARIIIHSAHYNALKMNGDCNKTSFHIGRPLLLALVLPWYVSCGTQAVEDICIVPCITKVSCRLSNVVSDRKMNQDEGGGRDDRECDGGATAAAGDQPEEQPSGSKDKKVSFVI